MPMADSTPRGSSVTTMTTIRMVAGMGMTNNSG